ncbi:MAG: hypothetical protein KDB01_04695 [Planctomycetaceae bacterium]|nr:hypothetical protein [Planctomycetaceae bacterium]
MRPDISAEEAIRRIVHEGICADYVDVATVVKERFGLQVGSGQVEEVVHAMRQEKPGQPVPWRHHTDIGPSGGPHHESKGGTAPEPGSAKSSAEAAMSHNEVLKFVESMGGFDAARAAISELEKSLKNLMK